MWHQEEAVFLKTSAQIVIVAVLTRPYLYFSGPTTVMSEGTKNIVEAMKARGIRKVVGCMSGKPLRQKHL